MPYILFYTNIAEKKLKQIGISNPLYLIGSNRYREITLRYLMGYNILRVKIGKNFAKNQSKAHIAGGENSEK